MTTEPASMGDVTTIGEAARAIRSGQWSPMKLVERCIGQVQRDDDALHAFAAFTPDSAREAARKCEREIAAGRWRGPLHGVPVGVKDVIDVGGVATRAQSWQLNDGLPVTDAPAVQRWRDAGAVLLGKLTTHEFAFGAPSEAPSRAARNPWRPTHFAGGSSSGAAAGVASGMIFGALGSDTAGSVRSPAALCGVTGFKPGRAAIDMAGTVPLSPSLDTLGVIGRSAEDCALLFSACAAPGMVRFASDDDGWPVPGQDLRGVRLGVVRNFWREAPVDPQLSGSTLDAACEVFTSLGGTVIDVTLPALSDWNAAGFTILLAEAFALHERWLRERPTHYGPAFRDAVLAGAAFDAADYVAATAAARAMTRTFDAVMTHCDVLIAPIQPGEAPRFDTSDRWGFLRRPSFGIPFNLTDSPALSMCCGFGSQGLPLALQLVGARGAEEMVLRVAHAYQSGTSWHRRVPASGS